MLQRQNVSRVISAAQWPGSDIHCQDSEQHQKKGHVTGAHVAQDSGRTPQTGHAAPQQLGPDISRLPPLLQRQWNHPKNAHLGSISIKSGSGIRVWWTCDKCPLGLPHEWLATAKHRTPKRGTGCPFCAGKSACAHNSLAAQQPMLAVQWSNKNTDKPENYTVGSSIKKLWHCEQCGHEWSATIAKRTKKHQGCPKCANIKRQTRQRQPPVTESPHAMAHWDWEKNEEAGLHPSKLTCGSSKKPHWVCRCCPKGQLHRWTAAVHGVVLKNSGCPCCVGRQACTCNSLQSLYPAVVVEWDPSRNTGLLADYPASSGEKVWWRNSKRGSFQARITDRTRHEKGPE